MTETERNTFAFVVVKVETRQTLSFADRLAFHHEWEASLVSTASPLVTGDEKHVEECPRPFSLTAALPVPTITGYSYGV